MIRNPIRTLKPTLKEVRDQFENWRKTREKQSKGNIMSVKGGQISLMLTLLSNLRQSAPAPWNSLVTA